MPGVWASAAEINTRLGRGINIGNTYEAEQSWQSPFDPADLKRIADLGFTHVRLPIRWERGDRSLATAPYTLTPAFLQIIEAAVDEALKQKLHIILNMHHHDALMANPTAEKARFLSQWEQIADHFKAYPDSLLFEILNEPHDQLTPTLWNDYLSDALQVIRESNPKRCVLIGTAEWGG
ncbi:MAG: glycoside hydrolase family 5 protein, partial [Clostridia bacterium]|nr:glycoside hydrolase family 5 protein [Clostridia bacterium]